MNERTRPLNLCSDHWRLNLCTDRKRVIHNGKKLIEETFILFKWRKCLEWLKEDEVQLWLKPWWRGSCFCWIPWNRISNATSLIQTNVINIGPVILFLNYRTWWLIKTMILNRIFVSFRVILWTRNVRQFHERWKGWKGTRAKTVMWQLPLSSSMKTFLHGILGSECPGWTKKRCCNVVCLPSELN